MDHVVTFVIRLGLGIFMAVMLGLLGLALATLVIPPVKAGEAGDLLARVAMIGSAAGVAGAAAWSTWRDLRRETYINLSLALFGGVGGALGSYAWIDAQYEIMKEWHPGLRTLEHALLSGRTIVVTAVVGANLPSALYSLLIMIRALKKKRPLTCA
jgi:hypothetical protein